MHDDDDDRSVSSEALGISSSATSFTEDGAGTTTSRFWGVRWDRRNKKWQARYRDADGKEHRLGQYDDDEEAARAVNKAIRDAGLEGQRHMNAIDATGALVPKRAAVVAPDPARAPTEATSKYWGVHWHKRKRRWQASYHDANGKHRSLGSFDTQEAAAHAYNAAIRALPPDVQVRRKTNPVVDGQLVPRTRKRYRVAEPTAAPPRRSARRSRQE